MVFEFANQVNDLLRASDRERRNQHGRVAMRGVVDDSRKRDFRIFRVVQTIAVSRFDHQIITRRRGHWIANDRLIVVTEIAGKEHAPAFAVCAGAVNLDEHHARAENVAGCFETDPNATADFESFAVVCEWTNQLQRGKGVFLGRKAEALVRVS